MRRTEVRPFSFGSIRIDGVTHEYDVVIDRGEVHKRKKKLSKKFQLDLLGSAARAQEQRRELTPAESAAAEAYVSAVARESAPQR